MDNDAVETSNGNFIKKSLLNNYKATELTELDQSTLVDLASALEESATALDHPDLSIRAGSKRSASPASASPVTTPAKVSKAPTKPPRGIPVRRTTSQTAPEEESASVSFGEPRTEAEIAADNVGDLQVVVRRADGSLGLPRRFNANVGFLTEQPDIGYVQGKTFKFIL